MRWIKFVVFAVVLLLAVFGISLLMQKDSKTVTVEHQIAYPVERVYPQFSNLQNFTRWNTYFSGNKDLTYSFFSPYEGKGSSMRYQHRKSQEIFGEMYIRYANPNKTLRYQLYEGTKEKPFQIDIKFKKQNNSTSVRWSLTSPPQSWLEQSMSFFLEDDADANVSRSMKNLFALLGNKVQKEQLRENMKFDTVMVEEREGQLLLGVNVSTKNGKDVLFKNIILNHNKVLNFVKTDLGKEEDEYGEPVLITGADNFKDKEISYFYGIPVSARVGVSDNNFTFRTVNSSRNLVIYYRGAYSGRLKAIQQLLQSAKEEGLRTGDLQQTFLDAPFQENTTLLKLSLPVFR